MVEIVGLKCRDCSGSGVTVDWRLRRPITGKCPKCDAGMVLRRMVEECDAQAMVARAVAEERDRVRAVLDKMLEDSVSKLTQRYCCLEYSTMEAIKAATINIFPQG